MLSSLMAVRNESRDTLVLSQVVVARSFWRRWVGLVGRRRLPVGQGLWLPACRAVHTVGMLCSLDIMFLDSHLEVVALHREVQPWRPLLACYGADSVLEAPCGTIVQSQTLLGDKLSIDFLNRPESTAYSSFRA